jgi:uncharacterized membrane protein YozB (DUF420 family)
MKLRDRLLARVPERHRPLAGRLFVVLAGAFLLFELSRFAAVLPLLAPVWPRIERETEAMTAAGPAVAVLTLSITALAIAIPMWAVIKGMRWAHRRLFH